MSGQRGTRIPLACYAVREATVVRRRPPSPSWNESREEFTASEQLILPTRSPNFSLSFRPDVRMTRVR